MDEETKEMLLEELANAVASDRDLNLAARKAVAATAEMWLTLARVLEAPIPVMIKAMLNEDIAVNFMQMAAATMQGKDVFARTRVKGGDE